MVPLPNLNFTDAGPVTSRSGDQRVTIGGLNLGTCSTWAYLGAGALLGVVAVLAFKRRKRKAGG